jgi:hypothetical protein
MVVYENPEWDPNLSFGVHVGGVLIQVRMFYPLDKYSCGKTMPNLSCPLPLVESLP